MGPGLEALREDAVQLVDRVLANSYPIDLANLMRRCWQEAAGGTEKRERKAAKAAASKAVRETAAAALAASVAAKVAAKTQRKAKTERKGRTPPQDSDRTKHKANRTAREAADGAATELSSSAGGAASGAEGSGTAVRRRSSIFAGGITGRLKPAKSAPTPAATIVEEEPPPPPKAEEKDATYEMDLRQVTSLEDMTMAMSKKAQDERQRRQEAMDRALELRRAKADELRLEDFNALLISSGQRPMSDADWLAFWEYMDGADELFRVEDLDTEDYIEVRARVVLAPPQPACGEDAAVLSCHHCEGSPTFLHVTPPLPRALRVSLAVLSRVEVLGALRRLAGDTSGGSA